MIKVYAKLNTNKYIIDIGSEIFISDVTDYVLIDEGEGDKYAHAQSQYLEKGLMDDKGRYNYKFVDSVLVEVAEEDKPTVEEPKETATQQDKIEAQVMYTALMTDTLLESEE